MASSTPSAGPIAAPSASASASPALDPVDDAWLVTGSGGGLVRIGEPFPFAGLEDAGLTTADAPRDESFPTGCLTAESPDGWIITAAVDWDYRVATTWVRQTKASEGARGEYLVPLTGAAPALADGTTIGTGMAAFLAAYPDARSADGQGRHLAGNGFDDHSIVLDGTHLALGAAEGIVDHIVVGLDHVPFTICS